MPTLHLLHGLPGSGKTTFAKKLARELPAVRFLPDEWMVALHGANPPAATFRTELAKVLDLVWAHIERVLVVGADVVFDGGLWRRAERDAVRDRAEKLGVACGYMCWLVRRGWHASGPLPARRRCPMGRWKSPERPLTCWRARSSRLMTTNRTWWWIRRSRR